jgi:hypothetical protein
MPTCGAPIHCHGEHDGVIPICKLQTLGFAGSAQKVERHGSAISRQQERGHGHAPAASQLSMLQDELDAVAELMLMLGLLQLLILMY